MLAVSDTLDFRGFDYHADRAVRQALHYRVGCKPGVELNRIREGLSLVVAGPDRDIVAVEATFTPRAGEKQSIPVMHAAYGGIAHH